MGFMTNMKGNRAYMLQSKGKLDEARKLYEEAYAGGLNDPRCLLAYAVLLLRSGEFAKAKDVLVKTQKAPGITAEQKTQLFMNYAACVYRLGDIDKGIHLLERQHLHQPAGLIYQTLGFLYVEKYDMKNRPAADAVAVEAPADTTPSGATPGAEDEADSAEASPAVPAEPEKTPLEAYEEGVQKALAFCQEAIAYDDEDAICMDNIAQMYYRVLGDRDTAKQWFDKAIAIKPGQIDTLWFLSRYDLEAGDRDKAVERLEKCLNGRFSPLNYATKDGIQAELERLKK